MQFARMIRLVAALAALWQVIGIVSYLAYVGLFGEAARPVGGADMPALVHACYAIGVFSGAAGAAGLALLRSWARPVLWLSLVTLVVDWGWALAFDSTVSPALGVAVLLVSALLVVLAEMAGRRGLLNKRA